MSGKTSFPRRRRALALTGTALAGCTLFSAVGAAQAQQLIVPGQEPYIAFVDNRQSFGEVDGHELFQVDHRDFDVVVVGADGSLDLTDETGEVVCTNPVLSPDAHTCPVHMEPGEHQLTGTITTADGRVLETATVTVQSFAPEHDEGEQDGRAPSPATVVSTAEGEAAGTTLVTLGGAPGDRVIVRSPSQVEWGQGAFDEDGRFTVEVWTTGTTTTPIRVETRRSDQRLVTDLEVRDESRVPVRATELALEGVERTGAGTVEVVLRGTPSQRYLLSPDRGTDVEGTVPEDGLIHWTAEVGDRTGAFRIATRTWGDQWSQTWKVLQFEIPDAAPGDDEEPVVAQPGGTDVDPDFTVRPGAGIDPIVAQPGGTDVDPGFTVPGDDDAASGISVAETRAGHQIGVTEAVLAGERWTEFSYRDGDSPVEQWHSISGNGRAVVELADLYEGESRVLHLTVRTASGERHQDVVVEGKAERPAVVAPFELVEVLPSSRATAEVVLRGTPGKPYELHGAGTYAAGRVPEDGLVRADLRFDGPSAVLEAAIRSNTSWTGQWTSTSFEIDAPEVPVVAEPADGQVDDGFTVAPSEPAEPVVAVPADGQVDEGFTAPVVAEPADGQVDDGFTAPVDETDPADPAEPVVAEPGEGAIDPNFGAPSKNGFGSLQARQSLVSPSYNGTALLQVSDPEAGPRGYGVLLRVDGKVKNWVTVTTSDQSVSVRDLGLGSGEHTVEFLVDQAVVRTLVVTV